MKKILPPVFAFVFVFVFSSCGVISDVSTEVYYGLDNPVPVRPDDVLDTLCTVKYFIDNNPHQSVIRTQLDLDFFLYTMIHNAEKGATVSIQTNTLASSADRKAFSADNEPLSLTTTDSNRVKEWTKRMLLKGYKVSIIYDRKKKTYTCTAYQSK